MEDLDGLEVEGEGGRVWTLDTLPVEVLLKVLSYIPSSHLQKSVALVSSHFHEILKNEKTWMIRSKKECPDFPPVPTPKTAEGEENFRWSLACLKREEHADIWRRDFVELRGHIACVDAVHLFKSSSYLATGSRDRSIILYKIEENQVKKLYHINNAHKGWIWSFQTDNQTDTLISGSWDTYITLTSLPTKTRITTYKTPSAVLCLSKNSSLISAGLFDKKVALIDPRTQSPIRYYTPHKKSILSIGSNDNHIITCSEDKQSSLYDIRAGKVIKSIKFEHYPKCCSFAKHSEDPLGMFYVGDIKGNLHLVDYKNFEIVRSYYSVHKRAVQGVVHTLGGVITCSSDCVLKVFSPGGRLGLLREVRFEGTELPGVCILENKVALAGGDSVVRLWR